MLIKPPKTEFVDFYEKAKFMLTWRVILTFTLFLPVLSVVMLFVNEGTAYPTFTAFIVCLYLTYKIYRSKDYKFTAYTIAVFGSILALATLILFPKHYHFVDTMWIFIIVIFTYFTLGKKWGVAVFILNTIGVIYYIMFVLEHNLQVMNELNTEHYVVLSINFIVSVILNAYLLSQFIVTTKHAENTYINLNDSLKQNNQEKTILLKEIHHRVKNNLQVITSLLRLQSREIEDSNSKEIYNESINRVVAMALIHEKMYQTKDLTKINLESYIFELSEDLKRTYAVRQELDINITSELKSITPKSLVPIALIFNELISNSLKHAFKNIEKGKIDISIEKKNQQIIVFYKDNGKWMAERKKGSFGLELIETLTEQLNGQYELEKEKGTCYKFTFPDNL